MTSNARKRIASAALTALGLGLVLSGAILFGLPALLVFAGLVSIGISVSLDKAITKPKTSKNRT